MDLNYLLHREQVSLMRADKAGCNEARQGHRALARAYGLLVTQLQADLGATAVRQAY